MNSHNRNQQNHFFSNSAAGTKFDFSSIIFWVRVFYNDCIYQFVHDQEPRIWQKRDRFGDLQWYAHDPLSGRSIQCVSEGEVRVWLENVLYR